MESVTMGHLLAVPFYDEQVKRNYFLCLADPISDEVAEFRRSGVYGFVLFLTDFTKQETKLSLG